jgi:hypothetical protein
VGDSDCPSDSSADKIEVNGRSDGLTKSIIYGINDIIV